MTSDDFGKLLQSKSSELQGNGSTQEVHMQASRILAFAAQKDMDWKKAIQGPNQAKLKAAFNKERDELIRKILTPIIKSHPLRARAEAEAISGRWLLDEKRDESWKCRGVKQGHKECRLTADGPDFNYASHVTKFSSIRTSLLRPNRGKRKIAIQDVATAFLQANAYSMDPKLSNSSNSRTPGQENGSSSSNEALSMEKPVHLSGGNRPFALGLRALVSSVA